MEENEEIGYRVHWICFYGSCTNEQAFLLYDLLFKEHFGDMEPLGHGGRGSKKSIIAGWNSRFILVRLGKRGIFPLRNSWFCM